MCCLRYIPRSSSWPASFRVRVSSGFRVSDHPSPPPPPPPDHLPALRPQPRLHRVRAEDHGQEPALPHLQRNHPGGHSPEIPALIFIAPAPRLPWGGV